MAHVRADDCQHGFLRGRGRQTATTSQGVYREEKIERGGTCGEFNRLRFGMSGGYWHPRRHVTHLERHYPRDEWRLLAHLRAQRPAGPSRHPKRAAVFQRFLNEWQFLKRPGAGYGHIPRDCPPLISKWTLYRHTLTPKDTAGTRSHLTLFNRPSRRPQSITVD